MAMVDWGTAVSIGGGLSPAGPDVTRAEAEEAVAELYDCAAAAVEPVRRATGLVSDPSEHRTVVVDRQEWIASSTAGFQQLLAPLEDRLGGSVGSALGAKASAVEVGAALAWVSTKVLGQFEVVTPPSEPARLLLVAPNIVAAELALDVPARDFRMWVSLHEETHRVQFGAVPWLSDHFRAEVDVFLSQVELDGGQGLKRAGAVLLAVLRVLGGASGATILDAIQTPAQREVFDRLRALMSLLEGHADHVMDRTGPDVVPSLEMIRERFDRRRANPGAVDGLLRRLVGMDQKMQQYTEGRAFVDHVVDRIGVVGFNAVWQSPAHLPSRDEIADPQRWITRIH